MIYEESFSSFLSSKERWLRDYAYFLNFDYSILSQAVVNYEFESYLDNKDMEKMRKVSISFKDS
ncbi:hypothetical protein [Sulfuracidifex metallicus]|nr:hypothetical protein [Sulfuracidifex metallicus]